MPSCYFHCRYFFSFFPWRKSCHCHRLSPPPRWSLRQHLHSGGAMHLFCLPTQVGENLFTNLSSQLDCGFIKQKNLIISVSILPSTAWHLFIPLHFREWTLCLLCHDLKCIQCFLIMKFFDHSQMSEKYMKFNSLFWFCCIDILEK